MRQKDPLRALSDEERAVLRHVSRSSREAAAVVARAKAVLAVAGGATYTQAAQAPRPRSGDGVGRLVARLNQAGVGAFGTWRGGGEPAGSTTTRTRLIMSLAPPPPQQ